MKNVSCLVSAVAFFLMVCSPTHAAQEAETKMTTPLAELNFRDNSWNRSLCAWAAWLAWVINKG